MSSRQRCAQYRELISSYLDGDLTHEERDRLLSHMATCDSCRRTLEAYRQIGTEIRSMPPIQPPHELADTIFAQTIYSGPRRIYLFTSKVGYSVGAVAAVFLLFVVGIYLLVNGLQRSVDPEVVASVPQDNVVWPLQKPIEITFNKAMDEQSVEDALAIIPASERERLNLDWDGNTLIIGQNQTLKPGSSYRVSIDRSAQDKWGNPINQEFKVQFETSTTVALETPESIPPTPTATVAPTPPPTQTQPVQPTSDPGQSTQAPPAVQPTEPGDPTEPPAQPTDTSDGSNNGTQVPAPPEPTATNTSESPVVEPTATSTPQPTATPTTPPTATPTATSMPTPIPTATATPTSTQVEEPIPTATPDTIPVTGAFGGVYWNNPHVQESLGEPVGYSASMSTEQLDFQHGSMFLRRDINSIYVFQSTGPWSLFPNVATTTPEFEPGPEPGTWIPGGPLGFLWREEEWIQNELDYALEADAASIESQSQAFEFGTMLYSRTGLIYILYDSGSWEALPDPT